MSANSKSIRLRWVLLGSALLALILVPFLAWGPTIEVWTGKFVSSATTSPHVTALVLGGLLASDILLPVPSSIVSTACGYLLGIPLGLLTSLVGMIMSCVVGYWLGVLCGRPISERLVGREELTKLERMSVQYGYWIIIITRPIPVLAEAAVLVAGIGKMSFWRFLLLSTVANVLVSGIYVAVGYLSASMNSFLLALAASILVSYLARFLAPSSAARE
ncbi:MAG: DedA family protein [Lentisphaerales bacterium]|jgi:membrane protein DedA with SNARE-associated domain|nr:MAG: DedA family protein [Lentisphaerales bacterium]